MNGRKKIESIQKEFTEKFNYLTLIFLDEDMKSIDVSRSLAEVRTAKGPDISIMASLKVNTLEQRFMDSFGITVEVAYSKDGKVMHTKNNVDKTLNEMNRWCEENSPADFVPRVPLVHGFCFGLTREVIERVGNAKLKVYLYHIPAVSGVPITLKLIEMLRKRYPDTVVGVKDSSGVWDNTKAMIDQFAADGFDVFPGSELPLTQALAIGGVGCISATANVNPAGIHAIYAARGTPDGAALQAKADVIRKIFQTLVMIPAMKRMAAEFSGQADWAIVRPPLTALDEAATLSLKTQLQAVGFAMPGFPVI